MRTERSTPAGGFNGEAVPAGITERHIHEECGVFGIYSKATADVASMAYYALYALQHRGQESAGIVVNDDGVFTSWRDVGLVSEVFPQERLKALGTGISLPLTDIEILHTESGQPHYHLTGRVFEASRGGTLLLTITHEALMAAAMCLWEE